MSKQLSEIVFSVQNLYKSTDKKTQSPANKVFPSHPRFSMCYIAKQN